MMNTLKVLFMLAWRNLWRNHRRTMIMLAAISVGAWAMIFMTALTQGMVNEMIKDGIASLGLSDLDVRCESTMKGGFRALQFEVRHPPQHVHRHMSDIVEILDRASGLSDGQKHLALRMFEAVAEAEARVHGSSVEKVHFHEVGALDSIADIIAAAIGFEHLGCDAVVCSPIPTGYGQVRIDHGICTVPTPGTVELLKGIPLVEVPIEAELTTPTGAAIVRTVVAPIACWSVSWMRASDSMSTEAVASSSTRMRAPLSSARHRQSSWRWPRGFPPWRSQGHRSSSEG